MRILREVKGTKGIYETSRVPFGLARSSAEAAARFRLALLKSRSERQASLRKTRRMSLLHQIKSQIPN